MARQRRARIEDVHDLAVGMPDVRVDQGPSGNAIYQVGRKSFVFFRNPRPDAIDPEAGERYEDVIVFWVPSEADKQALVQDTGSPFFTTAHFDGHPSVLVRGSRIGEIPSGAGRDHSGCLALSDLGSSSGAVARRPVAGRVKPASRSRSWGLWCWYRSSGRASGSSRANPAGEPL